MTTRTTTCTKPSCDGQIRASYIDTQGSALGDLRTSSDKETVHPAECERCGTKYDDVLSVAMTSADLELIRQRLSESTRQKLQTTATEVTPGAYEIAMTEHDARDLASKAANLGLPPIANKVREALTGLTTERRQRQGASPLR
jgi:hypothetical protein